MDFASFLDRVGAKPAEVARKTGLHPSTIGRIRDKQQIPDARTMLKLDRWAEAEARAAHLKKSERLSWDYLLDNGEPALPRGRSAAA